MYSVLTSCCTQDDEKEQGKCNLLMRGQKPFCYFRTQSILRSCVRTKRASCTHAIENLLMLQNAMACYKAPWPIQILTQNTFCIIIKGFRHTWLHLPPAQASLVPWPRRIKYSILLLYASPVIISKLILLVKFLAIIFVYMKYGFQCRLGGFAFISMKNFTSFTLWY